MILIIGGDNQGKLKFAKSLLNISDESISDGAGCDFDCAFDKPVLNRLHSLVKRLLEAGIDPGTFAAQGIEQNREITIICNELGGYVVPIRQEDREWQEQVGRIQCQIAQKAEQVYRVFCSVPVLIKGKDDDT